MIKPTTVGRISDAPRFRTRAAPVLPRRLVLVASEKGGVGKSVFTRTLIDFLRSNGSRIAAYDADGGIGATLRVLGLRDDRGDLVDEQCAIQGVGYYQGRVEGERNMVLDCMASREPLCVHDLAGGLLGDLTRIIDEGASLDGFMAAIEAEGYRLTIVHVISPDVGSAQSVGRWLDLTEDHADQVAVVNLKHGKPPADFPFWYGFVDAYGEKKGGKTRARLLSGGGVEIEFPALASGTFAKLDASNIAFSRAADVGLSVTERAQVVRFLKEFGDNLAPAKKFLGIE